MFNKKRRSRFQNYFKNSRINLILAIIFLFGASIIYRLYVLQVVEYDVYHALAQEQHQVLSRLEPERGKILVQDHSGELFPVATNREFALVYVVPKEMDVLSYADTAEKIYQIFYEQKVKEEVEEECARADEEQLNQELKKFKDLSEEELAAKKEELWQHWQTVWQDKFLQEIRQGKIDAAIEERKKNIIENLIAKFSKPGDPYEPIAEKVDEETLNRLLALNLKGVYFLKKKYRFYPEKNTYSHLSGFFGFKGEKQQGLYGLEGYFNEELSGQSGIISAERDARGRVIIMNSLKYRQPVDGADLVLTIDRTVQYTVCQKLEEAVKRHGADKGTVVIIQPFTGAIIAMCSVPNYDPNNYQEVEDITLFNNPAIFNQYEPGSVFKVITMAAGLDLRKVEPNSLFHDKGYVKIEGWPKPIRNSDYDTHGPHGWVTMTEILEKSLNTGIIFVKDRVGDDNFVKYVKLFGFGEKTGIEMESEASGNISNLLRKRLRPIDLATAAFGQGIAVTPLQMAMAYGAIANGGILMKPFIVKEIKWSDGSVDKIQPKQIRRVISERAALLLGGMMTNVIENGHAKRAAIPGYYVAGKTGTAQVPDKKRRGYSDKTIHTFIGFAPADEPRFVMLVRLDDPKDVRFAASSAAPLFGEIGKFLLNYWQVPEER
ncbi:penicillin-binding protein 2 [Candidatus Parcubacteria bacterium]|nr:MAG: penicillin-binding protein 2 [Candidatus Parcubacteria bacterium]